MHRDTEAQYQNHSPRVAVSNDFDLNSFGKKGREDVLDEVLIHPTLHLAHPKGFGGLVRRGHRGRRREISIAGSIHVRTGIASAGRSLGRIVGHRD